MTSVHRPSVSTRRMGARARFARAAVAGTVLLAGVSGCAQVDLDQLAGPASRSASPAEAPHTSTAPSRMVMPTALPTAQATAAAALTVSFPDLPGYTASTASPTATSAPHGSTTPTGPATASTPEASWSRSYASTSSGCQVSAEVTSSPELVATGATTMRCPSTGPSPWPASTRTTGRPRGWSSRRPTGPSPMPVSLRPSVPASPVLRSSGGPSRGYGPPTAPLCP